MQFALLGHPLGHSLSPQVHSLLARCTGAELQYTLRDVPPQELPEALPELLGLDGFNVTIPYKGAVIPYLARLDESAARYGAVNTVAPCAEGTIGYNTDCTGFLRSLGDWKEGLDSVLVLGAGGVGRMFAIECARLGAAVTLAVRESSLPRAGALAEEISAAYRVPARALLTGDAAGKRETYSLLINATPCGMFPHLDECPAPDALIERCERVFDCIYNPAETRLLRRAGELGKPALGGLRMLILQAAAAQEIWYGAKFREEQLEEIEERLAQTLCEAGSKK